MMNARCRNFGILARTGLAALLLLAPMDVSAQQRPPARIEAADAAALGPTAELAVARDAAQQRTTGRYTKRGMVVGAIAGTLAGIGIGSFLALLCESEGDGCDNALPVVTLLGAASGAVAGAIIGAAIPRPVRESADSVTETPTPQPAERATPRRIGSVSVAAGGAVATIRDGVGGEFEGSGPALRFGLAAELLPWLALGPEVGQAWFGDGGTIRHGALAVRLTLPRPRIAPYVSANIGAYDSSAPSLEYLGGGLGVGARLTPVTGHRYFVDAELRASRNIQNIEPMRMATLSVDAGLYW